MPFIGPIAPNDTYSYVNNLRCAVFGSERNFEFAVTDVLGEDYGAVVVPVRLAS